MQTEKAPPVPYFDLPAQIRSVRKDLDAAIARTLDNCSFCLGPDTAQFEKDFAKYIGAEHCVGFNSGTSGGALERWYFNSGSCPSDRRTSNRSRGQGSPSSLNQTHTSAYS